MKANQKGDRGNEIQHDGIAQEESFEKMKP